MNTTQLLAAAPPEWLLWLIVIFFIGPIVIPFVIYVVCMAFLFVAKLFGK